jgi:hypothetical protein
VDGFATLITVRASPATSGEIAHSGNPHSFSLEPLEIPQNAQMIVWKSLAKTGGLSDYIE